VCFEGVVDADHLGLFPFVQDAPHLVDRFAGALGDHIDRFEGRLRVSRIEFAVARPGAGCGGDLGDRCLAESVEALSRLMQHSPQQIDSLPDSCP
jgi:hypothetical protein